jgi:exportin-1
MEFFNFDTLNSLSWIVGSLSGSIQDREERTFFISTLRTLLQLCENKKGKENKAVIASCIMYVVGQYPSFLRHNWTFLKTVVKKLF